MNPITAKLLLFAPFAALLAASATFSRPAQDPSEVLVTSKITENVFIVEGGGGNVGLCIGGDGVLLVDDQTAETSKSLQIAIDDLLRTPVSPRMLINTHHHPDHTGGNPQFGRNALVIAHDNVRRRLLEAKAPAAPMTGIPVVTFADGATVHYNGLELRLKHFANAHTDGDTVVEFGGANVWHLGDLFFNKRFPFIDTAAGGSLAGLERAIDDLLAVIPENARIIPGHGMLATRADLARYREMLAATRRIIGQAVQNGKTAEEIVSSPLLDFYAAWSWDFVPRAKYVATVMSELEREAKAGK